MTADATPPVRESTHSLTAPAGPAIVTGVQQLLERVWQSQPTLVDSDRTRFRSAVIEVVGTLAAIRPVPAGSRLRTTMTVLVSCDERRLLADVRGDGAPLEVDLDAIQLPEGLVYERSPGSNRWWVTCPRD